ncbi:MAG: plasmid pRiA4b ORF-3 family protein [Rhodospirillales bacterium]|nr:plasmid pRiA4b ORF-3 family protein [Rhodospirillales bacterium]
MIDKVARVRIKLRKVRPPVWRRVDVPVSCTLAELHDIVQAVMGWRNSHMHEFKIGGRSFAALDPDRDPGDGEIGDARSITLKTVIERGYRRFDYLYDFGDHWEHEVVVEDVRDGEAGIEYPAFVEGARRCPPENVGGPPGFKRFLEAVLDPAHEEHRSMIEWSGKAYDPADIDEGLVRARMEDVANLRRGARANRRRGGRRSKTGGRR